MGGEWVDKAVGDIADVVGGSTPSTRDPANFDGDVPWLTPKDLSSPHSRYVKRGERNLSSKGFESCSAQLLPANSVLLSSRAPIGYLAIAANPIATNQGFRSLIVRPAYDHEFLYYWLSGNIEELERHSSGSTFKELSGTALKQIRLRLPVDRDEQRAIARILGTLDNKIELNRRMNATLEAMARALFQSWFVDFDPVRAKLDGRPPAALAPATAALFPATFQDSPLGLIPHGWDARSLAELVDVVKGRSYRSEELAESKTALVTLKSFLRGGGYRTDGLKAFTGEYKPNQRVRPGDLVVAFTDVTQAADVIGKPALVRSDDRFDTLVASLDVGIVRPKSKHASIPFLYCLFLTAEFQAHTYSHATGTTVLHLGSTAIPSFVSIVPPVVIAEKFAERADPIFRLIDENAKQSRTLATLRDTLLPKLLSGELSVAEATGNRDLQVQPGMPKP